MEIKIVSSLVRIFVFVTNNDYLVRQASSTHYKFPSLNPVLFVGLVKQFGPMIPDFCLFRTCFGGRTGEDPNFCDPCSRNSTR